MDASSFPVGSHQQHTVLGGQNGNSLAKDDCFSKTSIRHLLYSKLGVLLVGLVLLHETEPAPFTLPQQNGE
jgi:hypothetical protein